MQLACLDHALSRNLLRIAIVDTDDRRTTPVKLLAVYPPVTSVPLAATQGRRQRVLVFPVADCDLAHFLIRRSGRLPLKHAMFLTGQLTDALAYVHFHDIVHRDVKPANILLTSVCAESGLSHWHVELADFGMARFTPATSRGKKRNRRKTEVTISGIPVVAMEKMTAMVCTEWYRAPELSFVDDDSIDIQTDAVYGSAIDVWSLGCVIYELLRGHILGRATDAQGMFNNLVSVLGHPPSDCLTTKMQQFAASWTKTPGRDPLPVPSGAGLVAPQGEVRAAEEAAWSVVAASLQWCPEARPSAKRILASEWLQHLMAPPTSANVAESALAAPQGHGEVSEVFALTVLNRWRAPIAAQRSTSYIESATPCACTGHCYQPGHRRHGCSSKRLALGSRLCDLCVCGVCPSPRFNSDLCFSHSRIFRSLPEPLQLVRSSRKVLHEMIPDDMNYWLDIYPLARNDVVILFILAFLKEPTSCKFFVEELARLGHPTASWGKTKLTADVLRHSLEGMLTRCKGLGSGQVILNHYQDFGLPDYRLLAGLPPPPTPLPTRVALAPQTAPQGRGEHAAPPHRPASRGAPAPRSP